ncbi:MAG: hypothetical protein AAF711_01125 [Planctomycetota bacterium]
MDEQDRPQEPELTDQERKLARLWVLEGLEIMGRGDEQQLGKFTDKMLRDLPVRMQRAIQREMMDNIPEIEFQHRLRRWLERDR